MRRQDLYPCRPGRRVGIADDLGLDPVWFSLRTILGRDQDFVRNATLAGSSRPTPPARAKRPVTTRCTLDHLSDHALGLAVAATAGEAHENQVPVHGRM